MSYQETGIQGWMTLDELNWLHQLAGKMSSIVEIGCWKGRSTHALLSGCKGPVFAVDHFQGSQSELETTHREATEQDIEEIFLKNVGHFKNLNMLSMSSRAASRRFEPVSIDMVFIDGGHEKEEVIEDLRLWLPVYKKLLCGHDYGDFGVAQALKEMKLSVEVVPNTSIWRLSN